MNVTQAKVLAQKYLDDQITPPDGMRYVIVAGSIKELADGISRGKQIVTWRQAT